MKLKQYKEKKNHKKLIVIGLVIIALIGGVAIGITFANFKTQKSFKVMDGNFIYEGSGDVIFAFYNYDTNSPLEEMPKKDDNNIVYFSKAECDNGAIIEWNEERWAPLVLNLTKSKTKCNIYFSNMERLRTISSDDREGMWEYKYKITKIVMESSKNKKEAEEGQTVYGPFDESNTKNNAIESYVICDSGDTNCIGYLQEDGGIKLNSNTSYLFYDFNKVTQIEGMENLDTFYVTDMESMFSSMKNLQTLDLSNWDTSKVTNMSFMFSYMSNLQTLTFGKNFNTTSVTNMYHMFSNMSSIVELDLSNFDTSSVTDMQEMFYQASNLKKIVYGSNFVHKDGAITAGMFSGCKANKPDTNVHSSWSGIF